MAPPLPATSTIALRLFWGDMPLSRLHQYPGHHHSGCHAISYHQHDRLLKYRTRSIPEESNPNSIMYVVSRVEIFYVFSRKNITVQQVGLAYGPIRACSYSYTAQAAGPQRSPRKASLTPGSADAMREKSMFAAYIDASVGHS